MTRLTHVLLATVFLVTVATVNILPTATFADGLGAPGSVPPPPPPDEEISNPIPDCDFYPC